MSDKLVWPIPSNAPQIVGGQFGDPREYRGGTHMGEDIYAQVGTPLLAIGKGKITYSPGRGNAGNVITLQTTIPGVGKVNIEYMHTIGLHPQLKDGAVVEAGKVIGYLGGSGTSIGRHNYQQDGGLTPAHLHLQTKKPNGEYVHPDQFWGRTGPIKRGIPNAEHPADFDPGGPGRGIPQANVKDNPHVLGQHGELRALPDNEFVLASVPGIQKPPAKVQVAVSSKKDEPFISVPANFDPSKPAHIVMFLHGDKEKKENDKDFQEAAKAALAAKMGPNTVVVAPDISGGRTGKWKNYNSPAAMQQFMNTVQDKIAKDYAANVRKNDRNASDAAVTEAEEKTKAALQNSNITLAGYSGGYRLIPQALGNDKKHPFTSRVSGEVLLDALNDPGRTAALGNNAAQLKIPLSVLYLKGGETEANSLALEETMKAKGLGNIVHFEGVEGGKDAHGPMVGNHMGNALAQLRNVSTQLDALIAQAPANSGNDRPQTLTVEQLMQLQKNQAPAGSVPGGSLQRPGPVTPEQLPQTANRSAPVQGAAIDPRAGLRFSTALPATYGAQANNKKIPISELTLADLQKFEGDKQFQTAVNAEMEKIKKEKEAAGIKDTNKEAPAAMLRVLAQQKGYDVPESWTREKVGNAYLDVQTRPDRTEKDDVRLPADMHRTVQQLVKTDSPGTQIASNPLPNAASVPPKPATGDVTFPVFDHETASGLKRVVRTAQQEISQQSPPLSGTAAAQPPTTITSTPPKEGSSLGQPLAYGVGQRPSWWRPNGTTTAITPISEPPLTGTPARSPPPRVAAASVERTLLSITPAQTQASVPLNLGGASALPVWPTTTSSMAGLNNPMNMHGSFTALLRPQQNEGAGPKFWPINNPVLNNYPAAASADFSSISLPAVASLSQPKGGAFLGGLPLKTYVVQIDDHPQRVEAPPGSLNGGTTVAAPVVQVAASTSASPTPVALPGGTPIPAMELFRDPSRQPPPSALKPASQASADVFKQAMLDPKFLKEATDVNGNAAAAGWPSTSRTFTPSSRNDTLVATPEPSGTAAAPSDRSLPLASSASVTVVPAPSLTLPPPDFSDLTRSFTRGSTLPPLSLAKSLRETAALPSNIPPTWPEATLADASSARPAGNNDPTKGASFMGARRGPLRRVIAIEDKAAEIVRPVGTTNEATVATSSPAKVETVQASNPPQVTPPAADVAATRQPDSPQSRAANKAPDFAERFAALPSAPLPPLQPDGQKVVPIPRPDTASPTAAQSPAVVAGVPTAAPAASRQLKLQAGNAPAPQAGPPPSEEDDSSEKQEKLKTAAKYVFGEEGAEPPVPWNREEKKKRQLELRELTGFPLKIDGRVGRKTVQAMREALKIENGNEAAIKAAEKRKEANQHKEASPAPKPNKRAEKLDGMSASA